MFSFVCACVCIKKNRLLLHICNVFLGTTLPSCLSLYSGWFWSLPPVTVLNGGTGENLSPLDSKEVKQVNPRGNQPWIFIGKTDVEAEAPVLWPPDEKS